jgi:uncharacterized protein YqjF (DUF2071 family)
MDANQIELLPAPSRTATSPRALPSPVASPSQTGSAITTPFLTAQWRHLAVLNFDVDPALLAPYVPAGTELDFFEGRTFLSLVGFEFHATRVWGLAIPFHQNFEEVNLRFYVRRKTSDGWRRGVCFLRELVRKRAVAWIARRFYGENYLTVPMRRTVTPPNGNPRASYRQEYAWHFGGREHSLELAATGAGAPAVTGSLDEFIIEHYWGYSGGPGRPTIEYRVEHPRWNLWPAAESQFDADAARVYGEPFAAPLAAAPASAFYADGSPVTVYRGERIA